MGSRDRERVSYVDILDWKFSKKTDLPDKRTLPDLRTVSGEMVCFDKNSRRCKKKDLARRNLVDSLTARTLGSVSAVQRVSCRFSEKKRPSSLPNSHSDDVLTSFKQPDSRVGVRDGSGLGRNDAILEKHLDLGHDSHSATRCNQHKADINFPELIRDLNSSLLHSQKKQGSSSGSSHGGQQDGVQAALLNVLEKPRDFRYKHNGRHKHLTPALEKLDRVSARSRTEQWVKQLPTERRPYHSPLYRLGNFGSDDPPTSTAVYESWIYEEARKSAKGSRRYRQHSNLNVQ